MQRADLLFAILLGGTVLFPRVCAADGTLAVGFALNVKGGGFVWGYSETEKQALKICRGFDPEIAMPTRASEAQKRCTTVGTVSDGCYAIAMDAKNLAPVTAAGWGIAATLLAAEDQALDMCKAKAAPNRKGECRVTGRNCEGSGK
jgi:Domain of unknown function (DUF4189)